MNAEELIEVLKKINVRKTLEKMDPDKRSELLGALRVECERLKPENLESVAGNVADILESYGIINIRIKRGSIAPSGVRAPFKLLESNDPGELAEKILENIFVWFREGEKLDG